jgi:cystathionine gamma-lyase
MSETTDPAARGFATRAVHAGTTPDPTTGAVMTPIYATSTFQQQSPGVHKGWEYSRTGNPTRAALESAVAELEDGARGFAFASGLAAAATILDLLPAGSHVVSATDVYGGTYRLFDGVRRTAAGQETTYVDASDLDAVEAAIRPDTRLLWVESPGNPLLVLGDLERLAEIGRRHGLLTVTDNTLASPRLQLPLSFGFDLVMHSATKYLNGHSDAVAGIVVTREQGALADRLEFLQNAVGAILDPFPSYLVLRGIKTLELRVDRHSANAQAVAEALVGLPGVSKVVYPGLPDHPQHELAQRQMRAFGGLVAAYLDADQAATERFLSSLEVFTLAESLGGVESLAGFPWSMSHGGVPEPMRLARGITPNLIRLSVGIEDPDDLIADLRQALARL